MFNKGSNINKIFYVFWLSIIVALYLPEGNAEEDSIEEEHRIEYSISLEIEAEEEEKTKKKAFWKSVAVHKIEENLHMYATRDGYREKRKVPLELLYCCLTIDRYIA